MWDEIRTQRTLIDGKFDDGVAIGLQKGLKQGIEQGLEQGREEGKLEEKRNNARNLLAAGVARQIVQQSIGLSAEELDQLEQETAEGKTNNPA